MDIPVPFDESNRAYHCLHRRCSARLRTIALTQQFPGEARKCRYMGHYTQLDIFKIRRRRKQQASGEDKMPMSGTPPLPVPGPQGHQQESSQGKQQLETAPQRRTTRSQTAALALVGPENKCSGNKEDHPPPDKVDVAPEIDGDQLANSFENDGLVESSEDSEQFERARKKRTYLRRSQVAMSPAKKPAGDARQPFNKEPISEQEDDKVDSEESADSDDQTYEGCVSGNNTGGDDDTDEGYTTDEGTDTCSPGDDADVPGCSHSESIKTTISAVGGGPANVEDGTPNKAPGLGSTTKMPRIRMEPLRHHAVQLLGRLAEINDDGGSSREHKRKRSAGKNKEKKSNSGHCRDKRQISLPARRPRLFVVGDKEFTAQPECDDIVPTIRLLALEHMPTPCPTYSALPLETRLDILTQFLRRFSWGENEDVLRCIDVFENIAADSYSRALLNDRRKCHKKYGDNKKKWKKMPPRWCTNHAIWSGLCDIWASKAWEATARTNRTNRTSVGRVPSYTGGSRSMYRTRKAMEKERGPGAKVEMKEVYDRTHMMNTPQGRIYVNAKAADTAEKFVLLGENCNNPMTEEERWYAAVGGEDRGRVQGWGRNKLPLPSGPRNREARTHIPAQPTSSTATSAESAKLFTKDEVIEIVQREVAATSEKFLVKMTEQHEQHKQEVTGMQQRYHAGQDHLISLLSGLFLPNEVSTQPQVVNCKTSGANEKGSVV